jgi:uncharacterized protein YunC (DUF1805 family)
MTQHDAVKTAGARLEAIERWTMLTFVAAALSAACLMVLAAVHTYLACDYLNAKRAMADSVEAVRKDMTKFRRPLALKP